MPETPDLPVLTFAVPLLHRGRNTTVRRGRKWHGVPLARLRLDDGSLSEPCQLQTELRTFSTLREADVRFEHDPGCRTIDGLLRELQRLYPGFSPDEEVTLCHFVFDCR